jgi:hypothetical protein
MTKGENSQIKLKSKATIGLEKFNIPKNAHVEYIVTLNDFEKVGLKKKRNKEKKNFFCLFVGCR